MPQPTYLNAWVAVNKLMREGNGWSGHERNCCFLNLGRTRLANVGAATQLDLPHDGRALAATDWDGDGRVDLCLSSRTGPRLRLIRNNVAASRNFLSIKLTGVSSNRDAIGARLVLHRRTNAGRRLIRTLRGGEGFLAQSSKWVHFGLGTETDIDRLEIHWPGNDVQTVTGIEANHRYTIREGQPAVSVDLANSKMIETRQGSESVLARPEDPRARIVLSAALQLPKWKYLDKTGKHSVLDTDPETFTLVNLWASWCAPCIAELDDFNTQLESLQDAGVDVLALNVDSLERDANTDVDSGTTSNAVARHERGFRFAYGMATEPLVRTLDLVQRGLLDQQRPLTLPTSFLLDQEQRLVIIYKGPVASRQVSTDVARIRRDSRNLTQMAVPFPGRWHNQLPGPDPILIAMRMIEIGDSQGAGDYLRKLRETRASISADRQSEIVTNLFLARLLADQNQTSQAIAAFEYVLQIDSNQVTALVELAHALLKQQRADEAIEHLNKALQLDSQRTEAMAYFALARLQQGRTSDAVQWYRNVLRIRPGWIEVANNLAWILATNSDSRVRDGEEAVRLARQICEATNFQITGMLDTLAAAYAEAGQFPEALKTIDRAAAMAKSTGDTEVLEKLLSRRRQYEAQQPFRAQRSP